MGGTTPPYWTGLYVRMYVIPTVTVYTEYLLTTLDEMITVCLNYCMEGNIKQYLWLFMHDSL